MSGSSAMLSWGVIGYGAALSAVLAAVASVVTVRERRPIVVAGTVFGAFAGPVGWNAILRATHADQFFHDAPIVVFPISWQDTGSGVFATASCALLAAVGGVSAECRSWCRVNGPPALPAAQPEAEPPRTGSV